MSSPDSIAGYADSLVDSADLVDARLQKLEQARNQHSLRLKALERGVEVAIQDVDAVLGVLQLAVQDLMHARNRIAYDMGDDEVDIPAWVERLREVRERVLGTKKAAVALEKCEPDVIEFGG